MSTRSLTHVFDESGKQLFCMYRHCDGYPCGHGAELAAFLKEHVPGVRRGMYVPDEHDIAAHMVSHFKGNSAGNFYLYPHDAEDVGEEYTYEVRFVRGAGPIISCREHGGSHGSPDNFAKWCDENKYGVSDD